MTMQDARPLMMQAANKFFDAAAAWDPNGPLPPPVFAARMDVGGGKSWAARLRAAMALLQRDPTDKRPIAFMVPTHALSEEAAVDFEAQPIASANGLRAAVWRGRNSQDPLYPEYKMCRDMERVQDAIEAGDTIESACCKSKAGKCPFFDICGFQRQKRIDTKPDVWVMAHETLYLSPPTIVGEPSTLVVDERMFDSGLVGNEGRHMELSVDTLDSCDLPGLDGQHLRHLRDLAIKALRSAVDGPISRTAMLKAGLTVEHAANAAKLEWLGKVDPKMRPDMTVKERKEALRLAANNKTVRRLSLFWRAIADLLRPDGPEFSGWAQLTYADTKEGRVRVLRLKGRKTIHHSWLVPTFVLDATLRMDLIREYWPTVELIADIRIQTPHQTVIQVTDKTFAKNKLDLLTDDRKRAAAAKRANDPDMFDDVDVPEDVFLSDEERRIRTALRDLNATLSAIARHFGPGGDLVGEAIPDQFRTLAVVQESVEKTLPTIGVQPPYLRA